MRWAILDAQDLRVPLTALRLLLGAVERTFRDEPQTRRQVLDAEARLKEFVRALRVHYPREGA